ncbi:MAG TPA: protein kinase [Longimicrobiales bacterium]|nr:protein kinase [Longimicrobiales bacterium]
MAPPVGLAEALQGAYEILEALGEGATATVYLARELKHDRNVALKVLRPELGAAVGADRFVREIQIAGRLSHPHVLPMFDSGEAGGFLYYTMPCVRGESLDARLAREGRLPVSEALAIAGQVASALHHAHQEGVIHRDIKPANILLADGHAWVADFGIARAVERAGGAKLTRTGLAVGTPTYMSPEQAFGRDTVDGRTDIYALGCVLFEMLKGRPPFEARTMPALMAKHATEAVPSLRIDDEAIPLFVERAVKQALAKDPADRFSSPRALAETLETETVVEVVGRRRLAVLPPTNVTADPEQEFLCLGLQEALISRLSKGDVAVLARSSVAHHAGSDRPARDIARELGVDSIVESSLFRSGDRVGIEARLVDGASEEGLWSESFEGDVPDVLRLYRDIADAAAEAVLGALAPRRPKTSELQVVDPAAYENYMRGRVHQQRFMPADLQRGLKYYETAIEIQPDYAAAHAGMALIWGSMTVLGMLPPSESGPLWMRSARRAVELGPELGEAHQAMAQGLTWYEWDFPAAETAWRRAIELDPHNPEAHAFYSHFLAMLHRVPESDAAMARALAVDPFNPFTTTLAGHQVFLTDRLAEAMERFAEAPPNPLVVEGVAHTAACLGRADEAQAAWATYFEMLGHREVADAIRSAASLEEGCSAGADQLIELSGSVFVRHVLIANVLAFAGRTEEAMDWYERGREIRDFQVAYLAAVAVPDEVRAHPRFRALLREVGLPEPRTGPPSPSGAAAD